MLPKILLVIFLGLFLTASCQTFSSRAENISVGESNLHLPNEAEKTPVIEFDDSQTYAFIKLKGDYKQVDAVLHVNVLSRELVDDVGGYVLYRLKSEVKEIFKGQVKQGNFEFYMDMETAYAEQHSLLGEQVVFLNFQNSDNYSDKRTSFWTLENSTRFIKLDVIEKIRKIRAQQVSKTINDTDQAPLYSLKSLKGMYEDLDEIVYADILSIEHPENYGTQSLHRVRAKVREVLKGDFEVGQIVEYTDLYEPAGAKDLLKDQVIFLIKIPTKDGKPHYDRLEYSDGAVSGKNILEKMRKIARKS